MTNKEPLRVKVFKSSFSDQIDYEWQFSRGLMPDEETQFIKLITERGLPLNVIDNKREGRCFFPIGSKVQFAWDLQEFVKQMNKIMTNKDCNIHTTNIVGAWRPVQESYDFEGDFEAPSKLFWCQGPHGEGHWTNDMLWEDCKEFGGEWFRNPDLKITHWTYVDKPKN